ncbi:MAG: tRNA epoxyqueuosine(34) reductase QueG [Microcystaceae cyanobacterium]
MNLNSQRIKEKAREIGFHLVGIAEIEAKYNDGAVQHLKTWLSLGYHAEMAWMSDPRRENLRQIMPDVQSVISVALNYYTPHTHSNHPQVGKISRYGWGRDYHRVMQKRLKALNQWLHTQESTIQTRYYVDTGPVQDKVWAQRAGLGWIGKNGNVISRFYGSWFFIGEIITNLTLDPDQPHTNHCGTCTRCLEACPTNAIPQPYVIDANRCIAYHTIENRSETLPETIQPHLNGWVAGCDICQDVCPWNQRFAQETDLPDFQPYPHNIAPKLQDLAAISPEDWDQRFRGSALRRIKPSMLRRNAYANLKR